MQSEKLPYRNVESVPSGIHFASPSEATPTRRPRITLVTPVYNGIRYIEETIRSIVYQGYPNLEYIMVDGGSSDGTVDIIRKYEKHISWWISRRDKGVYDALNTGFSRSTGTIMGGLIPAMLCTPAGCWWLAAFSRPCLRWIG
jgi:cellulose synthase/poly-beta-1,6-N-acetylglucosamine synthase-like glycosyltransferase